MNGSIYHYDGKEWSKVYTYTIQEMGEPDIFDLWGSSPSNIYAVGTVLPDEGPPYRGFVLHYDGKNWKQLLVTDFGVQLQRVRQGREGVIIRGGGQTYEGQEPPYTTEVFYRYSKGHLEPLFSTTSDETLWMNTVGGGIYYVVGNKIQVLSSGTFKTVVSVPEGQVPISVSGRSKNDLFITTTRGVLHYNGEDIVPMFQLDDKNVTIYRDLILKNDVFFLVNDFEAETNLIYHGTLTPKEK